VCRNVTELPQLSASCADPCRVEHVAARGSRVRYTDAPNTPLLPFLARLAASPPLPPTPPLLPYYCCRCRRCRRRALARLGVRGERIGGLTGVWVGGAKVAAIGVKVRAALHCGTVGPGSIELRPGGWLDASCM
jgi:hypothetical protein